MNGRGFAVVAEEVGKLAVISGKAAQDIMQLLEDSSKRVDQVITVTKDRVETGVTIARECENAFSSMHGSLIGISEAVQSISQATREQQAGVKQVNAAVLEIERVNSLNSNSAESLARQTAALVKQVGSFQFAVENLARFSGIKSGEIQARVNGFALSEVTIASEHQVVSSEKNVAKANEDKPAESMLTQESKEVQKSKRNDSRWNEVA